MSRAGKRWTAEEDEKVIDLFYKDIKIDDICSSLQRSKYAIQLRIVQHLHDTEDDKVLMNKLDIDEESLFRMTKRMETKVIKTGNKETVASLSLKIQELNKIVDNLTNKLNYIERLLEKK